jgi:hypothetical protein
LRHAGYTLGRGPDYGVPARRGVAAYPEDELRYDLTDSNFGKSSGGLPRGDDMEIDNFIRYFEWVHRMTIDFAQAVPDDKWEFTPDPPGKPGRAPIPFRAGDGFGPFSKQLRHVVNARGVYNAAMLTKNVDWTQRHYSGPLTREALLEALVSKQREFLAALETFDTESTIDFGGTALPFDGFACEMVHHEAIHHGQWSVYASLGGFETPLSWRMGWKM